MSVILLFRAQKHYGVDISILLLRKHWKLAFIKVQKSWRNIDIAKQCSMAYESIIPSRLSDQSEGIPSWNAVRINMLCCWANLCRVKLPDFLSMPSVFCRAHGNNFVVCQKAIWKFSFAVSRNRQKSARSNFFGRSRINFCALHGDANRTRDLPQAQKFLKHYTTFSYASIHGFDSPNIITNRE